MRPARTAIVGWVVLLGACDGTPSGPAADPPVAVEPAPEIRPVEPLQREAAAPTVDLVVREASLQREPGAPGWSLVVDLELGWNQPATYDGVLSSVRNTILRRDRFRLRADGTPVAAVRRDPSGGPLDAELIELTPREHPWHREQLVFPVGETIPDEGVLMVPDEQAETELRLWGAPRAPGGVPGVDVVALAPSGRPVVADGVLEVDGVGFSRSGRGGPWRVPVAPTGTLRIPGHRPLTVTLTDAPVPLVVRPVPDTRDGPDEVRFAAAWPSTPAEPSLARRMLDVVDVDDALEIVRAVGVLPANGVARSSDAVLRAGFGTPEERAVLFQDLLRGLGLKSRLTCTEPTPAQAAALYAGPPLRAPADWLARTEAELVPQVEALGTALGAVYADWAARPVGRRSQFHLVPEWCGVDHQVAGSDAMLPDDLRPDGLRDTPLPPSWRTTVYAVDDAWRVTARLEASFRDRSGAVRTLLLADKQATLAALSDAGMLFDLRPTAPGKLAAQTSAVSAAEVDGRLGETMSVQGAETIALALAFHDPDGIGSVPSFLEVWQRSDTLPEPPPLRVFISGDSGDRTGARAAELYRLAVDGAHPAPGAVALLARHAAYDALRAQLAGGVEQVRPSVRVTMMLDHGGRTAWRMETAPPAPPVFVGDDVPSPEEVAWLGAADAVARAHLLGVEPPPAPTSWLAGSDDLPQLGRVPPGVQVNVARTLPFASVGQVDPGILWLADPRSGGVGWWDVPGRVIGDRPVEVPRELRGAPGWASARWDGVIRCADAARFVDAAALPERCAPVAAGAGD